MAYGASAAPVAAGGGQARSTPASGASDAGAAGCYHCGLPLPASASWRVRIDGRERAMCCPGCAAVAQTIVDLGQEHYYRERSGYAQQADGADLVPPELRLYSNDDPRFALDADSRETTFAVEGIRCAACVWLIEQRLARLPGVASAQLNVATERLYVRWRADACQPGDILAALHAIGYAAYPYDALRHGEQLRRAARTLGRQLFVAGLSMMQVMMYVAPAYLSDGDGTLDESMAGLMRWASLLLTLPTICYSALPFWRGALASLRTRTLGMDVPVALGIAAAFGASVIATWRGEGEVYFDSVTMFVFLLLCSRYLELLARRKAAGAMERLQHALPASAHKVAAYPERRDSELVPAAALAAGDVILVKPGEAVPADSVVLDGATALDLSLLTGESAPQPRATGDALPGGAIVCADAVLARVTRSAGDSTLADLVRLIDRAGQGKPGIAQWADRVAAYFVAALLLFAGASFAWWYWHDGHQPARAWHIAIAVLVVSCPCALSLATPSALAASIDRLLRRGVLVVAPHALETLQRATHVVFDKTGTLTEGRPALHSIAALDGGDPARWLAVAAALEAGSAHPLARAITAGAIPGAAGSLGAGGNPGAGSMVGAAQPRAQTLADATTPRAQAAGLHASALQEIPGKGLEGTLDGQRYRLGSAAYVAELAGSAPPVMHRLEDADATIIYLGMQDRWLARLLLRDTLRADAQATVDHFHALGKTVVLLSGDDDQLTRRLAAQLGILHASGGNLPQHKLDYVRALQAQGAVVAMAGDGINDAAVLSAADVSFAMGSGAALAQAHADAVLLSGRIGSLADASQAARATMRVIRQNLAWATVYNLAAIPAAAMGYLNPWWSGVGMALSSAVVVLNALRLRR
ncbi:heavy metal translocating P-type ATPase [Oxalobacteraceae bacterium A2-2]